ncbi:MAG: hypothetical protein QG641_2517 [Candidatus Poribacteria bacterium]|nr:hypothetical protein [Candidatus Poribacteria bacterium]
MAVSSKLDIGFVFRIVLPGLILALLFLPILNPLAPSIIKVSKIIDIAIILIPEALIMGILLSLMRYHIYVIYEGRSSLWPKYLHDKLTNLINKKVKKALNKQAKLDEFSVQYREIWSWLRKFPIDEDGDPIALRPTVLGNILEGYEGYSYKRYGMDSVFYWYRLKSALPESIVKIFNVVSAEADCLMYISFSGFVMFFVYAIISILKRIEILCNNCNVEFLSIVTNCLSLTSVWAFPELWAICCLLGGYLIYRASFPLHQRNGEYFKSAFDMYRNKIISITNISKDEKEKWLTTFNYLQYMYIKCRDCQNHYYASKESCPHCAEGSDNNHNSKELTDEN